MSEPVEKHKFGCGAIVAIALLAFVLGRCSTEPSQVAEAPAPPSTTTAMDLSSDTARAEAAAAAGQADAAQLRGAEPDESIPSPAAIGIIPSTTYTGGDGFTDSAGHEVASPVYAPSAPADASAQCRDGTYSFSHSHSGTCSHHGGVASGYRICPAVPLKRGFCREHPRRLDTDH